jgi:high-affinity Fe2+/Pb2+ permease
LIGVHLANLFINWGNMNRGFENARRANYLGNNWSRLAVLMLFIGLDLSQYYANHSESTSYSAHAGGMLIGLSAGIIILRNPNKTDLERFVFIPTALVVSILLLVVGISWHAEHSPSEAMEVLGGSGSGTGEPCCWQLSRCAATTEAQGQFQGLYGEFRCSGGELRKDGVGISTCEGLLESVGLYNFSRAPPA